EGFWGMPPSTAGARVVASIGIGLEYDFHYFKLGGGIMWSPSNIVVNDDIKHGSIGVLRAFFPFWFKKYFRVNDEDVSINYSIIYHGKTISAEQLLDMGGERKIQLKDVRTGKVFGPYTKDFDDSV